jgi:hypothetical protein
MRCNAKAAKQAEKERKAAERKSKGSKWPQRRPGILKKKFLTNSKSYAIIRVQIKKGK